MMQIARFRAEHGLSDEGEQPMAPGENRIWNHILENHGLWDTSHVKPLYLTLRGGYGDVSLVVASRSADDFSDYIMKNIAHLDFVKYIWMFNLMEPRLFTVPRDTSGNFKRYTITLDVIPGEAPFIYESVSRFKPSPDIIITYVAFTYHRYSDFLISLIAKEDGLVEGFVKRYLAPMKGVIRTEIIPIIKSTNLASPEEWRDLCNQYFVVRKDDGIDVNKEDLDIYENWFKSGFE